MRHVAYGGIEDNPPLYYVLAELSSALGDPEVWLRLPSVLLGAATVPLVYAAGRLAAGGSAGVWAAALWTLSPFVLFYGTEGRAYATLAFFVVLSTVAGLRRSWVLYGIAVCAAMYSHYTAVFVLAAQAAWFLLARPEDRRPLLIAPGAAALAYLPWLPLMAEQQRDASATVIGAFYPVTLRSVTEGLGRQLCCHPYVPVRDLPGLAGLGAAGGRRGGAGGGDAARAAARPALGVRRRPCCSSSRSPRRSGCSSTARSAPGSSRRATSPRRSRASACVLGWLVARLPARAGLVAGGLLAAGLLIGAVQSLLVTNQRPDLRGAAAFIDARADAGDPYVETQLFFSDAPELARGAAAELRPRAPRRGPGRAAPRRRRVRARRAGGAWQAGGRGAAALRRRPGPAEHPRPPAAAARVRRTGCGGSRPAASPASTTSTSWSTARPERPACACPAPSRP